MGRDIVVEFHFSTHRLLFYRMLKLSDYVTLTGYGKVALRQFGDLDLLVRS
jgi:hypothetical protein